MEEAQKWQNQGNTVFRREIASPASDLTPYNLQRVSFIFSSSSALFPLFFQTEATRWLARALVDAFELLTELFNLLPFSFAFPFPLLFIYLNIFPLSLSLLFFSLNRICPFLAECSAKALKTRGTLNKVDLKVTLKQFYTGFSRLQRNPGDGYREFSAARSRAARNVAKYPATEPKSAIRIAEKKGKRDVPLCTFARFAMRATRKLRGEKVRKKRERERENSPNAASRETGP